MNKVILTKIAVDYNDARQKAKELVFKLKPHSHKVDIVGSLHRKHKNVNDIDLVISPKQSFFSKLRTIGTPTGGGQKNINLNYEGIPVNIFLTNPRSHDATKMHFALGKQIIRLKADAKKRGLKLSQKGLFKDNQFLTGSEKDIRSILSTPSFKKFIKQKQYPRETENFYRFRQVDPNEFVEFRTKKYSNGDAHVLGKKKDGTWDIQSVMIKKKNSY